MEVGATFYAFIIILLTWLLLGGQRPQPHGQRGENQGAKRERGPSLGSLGSNLKVGALVKVSGIRTMFP